MSKPRTSAAVGRRSPAQGRARRVVFWVVIVCVLLGYGARWWVRANRASPAASASAAPSVAVEPSHLSPERLTGRWQRPDGGYILEVRSARTDGALEVGYFNPRPIHVGEARWRQAGTALQVHVVLQDTGYPGATYALVLDAGRDRLVGTYMQPAAAQTFDVEFVRLPQ